MIANSMTETRKGSLVIFRDCRMASQRCSPTYALTHGWVAPPNTINLNGHRSHHHHSTAARFAVLAWNALFAGNLILQAHAAEERLEEPAASVRSAAVTAAESAGVTGEGGSGHWEGRAPALPEEEGRPVGGHTARHTAQGPAPTVGRLAELCSECECYLQPEEIKANERGTTPTARTGRCDDCYRMSPAPVAPIGGPSYCFGRSFRYETVPQTESTISPTPVGAGPSHPPCQHRARPQPVPCPHCEANALHRKLRQTMTLYHGPRPRQPPRPVAARRFDAYETEVEKAAQEGRIFNRQPAQITWCTHCQREYCAGDCSSTAFEEEAATLRGDTPRAAPAEDGYSSSETLRPERRQVLYFPALQRRHEVKNAAIQTRKPRVQNRATQTEAETLPLPTPAPLSLQRIVRLVLFLAAASLLLTFAASLPGAHARPLAAAKNIPSSATHLLRSFITISLLAIIAKKLVSFAAAAPYPEIPDLAEASATAVAAFCTALATAAAYAWQGGNKEVFGEEVVAEEFLRHSRWEDFLRDPAHPDFADWKGEGNTQYAKVIPDAHTKTRLKTAIIGLYSRILAANETAKRTDDFIEWMKNNSPADTIVKKLMQLTNRETGEEAIAKAERWGAYMQHQNDHIWTLFPETPENRRTSTALLSYVQQLRGLWSAVGSHAAGYTRTNGLPIDLGELKDLEEWLNNAPREFEKDVAILFTPRPKTRDKTIKRIQKLIESKCSHPEELAWPLLKSFHQIDDRQWQ